MKKLLLFALAALVSPLISKAQSNNDERDMPKSVEFHVGAALNITHTTPGNKYAVNGGKDYISKLPALTLGINIYPRPLTRKAYFGVEMSLGQNKYLSVYDNKVYPYTQVTYGYTQTFVSLTPQANLNIYNAENFKWFLGAGAYFQRNFYSDKKLSAADGSIIGSPYEFDLSKIQSRVMVKTGLTLKKHIQLFGYYLTPVITSSDFAYVQVKMQSTVVGINYLF